MNMAFGISEDDIANVLQQNAASYVSNGSRPFDALAIALEVQFSSEELDRIEQAALDSGVDLDEQTDGAYAEIKAILIERGVLAAS